MKSIFALGLFALLASAQAYGVTSQIYGGKPKFYNCENKLPGELPYTTGYLEVFKKDQAILTFFIGEVKSSAGSCRAINKTTWFCQVGSGIYESENLLLEIVVQDDGALMVTGKTNEHYSFHCTEN